MMHQMLPNPIVVLTNKNELHFIYIFFLCSNKTNDSGGI